mmetsp:Transcript_38599/g.64948  ORF Transcript_38599/g.64948 Transcript_38599/m.64948 type:complete len:537 (-) Transcript_38599:420-2030(-)
MHALAQLLAVEIVLQDLLHAGHASGPANQHDLGHRLLGELGVHHDALDGLNALLEQVLAQLLELCAGELHGNLLLADRALDHGGHGGRQLALGSLAGSADLALVAASLGGVGLGRPLVLALELRVHPVGHARVEVLTTQVSVSRRREHLEEATVQLEQGHVEGATAEIEDEHRGCLVVALVKTVGQGRRGGLVDDAHHLEAGNGTGILGEAALGVVEICGHRHHSLLHFAPESKLSGRLHLLQHHGGDLLGEERLLALAGHHDGPDDGLAVGALGNLERHALDLLVAIVVVASDDTLDVEEGAVGVHGRLPLGGVAHHAALVVERHPGGSGAVALGVRKHLGLAVTPDRNARVRGTKIDTNDVLARCGSLGLGALGLGHGGLDLRALGGLHLLDALLERGVVLVELQPVGVHLGRLGEVAAAELSQTQTGVALSPVRLDLNALQAILLCAIELAQVGVGSGAVGVEDVVVAILQNRQCELVDRLLVLAGRERVIASGFELLCLGLGRGIHLVAGAWRLGLLLASALLTGSHFELGT